jgi:hypothetical protein
MLVKVRLPLKLVLKSGEAAVSLGGKREPVALVLAQTVRLCGAAVV